jgi:putative transposase
LGGPGDDVVVPKLYPREFRDDVVWIARGREPGVRLEPENEVLRRAAAYRANALDRRTWATRGQLRIAIVSWIERTYHRRRRQPRIRRLTPIEYEIIMTTPAAPAA